MFLGYSRDRAASGRENRESLLVFSPNLHNYNISASAIDCEQSLFFAKVREANVRFTSGARRELSGRERRAPPVNRTFTSQTLAKNRDCSQSTSAKEMRRKDQLLAVYRTPSLERATPPLARRPFLLFLPTWRTVQQCLRQVRVHLHRQSCDDSEWETCGQSAASLSNLLAAILNPKITCSNCETYYGP